MIVRNTFVANVTPEAVRELKKSVALAGAPSRARLAALSTAESRPSGLDFERIIGTSDLLDLNWFDRGLRAAKSVCRVVLRDDAQRILGYGTGFLVAPAVLLTNNHVLGDAATASHAVVEFDYELDVDGVPKPVARFALDPATFFVTSPSNVLDATFCAVATLDPISQRRIDEFGFVRLNPQTGKIETGEWMTIVQHPSGEPKEVAARENQLLKIADTTLLYATDTAPGSSGSPVFNDSWQVVALHHSGVPDTDAQGRQLGLDGTPAPPGAPDTAMRWLGNEGMRVSKIVEMLRQQPPSAVRDAVLAVSDGQAPAPGPAAAPSAQPAPAHESAPVAAAQAPADAGGIAIERSGETLRFTVPADAFRSLRLGASPSAAPLAAPVSLEAAVAEKFVLDPDYGARRGYDPAFLSTAVPPPVSLHPENAVLRTDGKGSRLDYHHFSLEMNAPRKLLAWSASNSDRDPAVFGSRSRKALAGGASDSWIRDPRIPADAQIADRFYRGSGFDHGHVVRREDNYWGANELEATYANFDTFHFTNCTPQHPAYNRSQEHGLWGELENYIAAQSKSAKPKLSLFAGPVFGASDPDDRGVKIPKQFWKVVLADLDAGGIAAFAFVLSQAELITNLEADITFGPFVTYQVSVAKLESMLEVTFDAAVHAADRFAGPAKREEALLEAAAALRPIAYLEQLEVPPLR